MAKNEELSPIEGVFKEEYQRQQENVEIYKAEIAQYPKGSLVVKQQQGRSYVYLKYRDGKDVKTDYVGLDGSEEVLDVEKKVEKRKRAEKLLKESQRYLKVMEKGIRARN